MEKSKVTVNIMILKGYAKGVCVLQCDWKVIDWFKILFRYTVIRCIHY